MSALLRPVAAVVLVCLLMPLLAQPAVVSSEFSHNDEQPEAETTEPHQLDIASSLRLGLHDGSRHLWQPDRIGEGVAYGVFLPIVMIPMLYSRYRDVSPRTIPDNVDEEAYRRGYRSGSAQAGSFMAAASSLGTTLVVYSVLIVLLVQH